MGHDKAMEDILIRKVRTIDGGIQDIHIIDGWIAAEGGSSGTVIDGGGYLAIPGFCNTHTHAPMSLLRGAGEGLELDRWLREAIWPLEARMTLDHLRAGMRLSCLEMIRTGTTLFNDMYFREDEMATVVRDMGLRAVLGEGLIDNLDPDRLEREKRRIPSVNDGIAENGKGLVIPASAPHAVYTVSDEGFRWAVGEAKRIGGGLHVHAAETSGEVDACVKRTGKTPIGHLAAIGSLGSGTLVAHTVHLSDGDIELLSSYGANVSLNPVSNMKLGSGGPPRYPDLVKAAINVTLGTDGPASNNSQSMLETMKTAALFIRSRYGASSIGPADIFRCATLNGYLALGITGGSLMTGMAADLVLVDLKHHSMNPLIDPITNLVFSASPEAISYTIVNGRVLMENGAIEGADRIVDEANEAAADLIGRVSP
jgi:5-methylthioadenosine/S-adenosylhomocysteine deaminase